MPLLQSLPSSLPRHISHTAAWFCFPVLPPKNVLPFLSVAIKAVSSSINPRATSSTKSSLPALYSGSVTPVAASVLNCGQQLPCPLLLPHDEPLTMQNYVLVISVLL